MRVRVDVSCCSNKRGFGRFTRELLKALINIDQKNDYWFFVDDYTALENEFPQDVNMVIATTSVSPTVAASASGRRSLSDVWAMTREVLRRKLDIFFFPAIYSYYPIVDRAKIVVTIHDMTPKLYPEEIFPNKKLRLFWTLKEYLAIWQANLILTVSQHSKQEIIRSYKLSESRVATVSEGPKAVFQVLPRDTQLAQVIHRYHLNTSQRYLLYVGGISPHKNLQSSEPLRLHKMC